MLKIVSDFKIHNYDLYINNYYWIKVHNKMHTQTSEPLNSNAHCIMKQTINDHRIT